jgi:hypothetical protein
MSKGLETFLIEFDLLAVMAIWVSMNNEHGSRPQNLPPL